MSLSEKARAGTEVTPDGEVIGIDPRKVSVETLSDLGHMPKPVLAAIREKCLDCASSANEVRKCTAIACALWPFRMRKNPYRNAGEASEAMQAAMVKNGERLRNMRLARESYAKDA